MVERVVWLMLNRYPLELFRHCFVSKCWGHQQNDVRCKSSMFHVAGYHDNCTKNQYSWCQYRQNVEPILIMINVVFNWMYIQPFLLRAKIHVNERIYQNVCMGVHKTEIKVLVEWHRSCRGQSRGFWYP